MKNELDGLLSAAEVTKKNGNGASKLPIVDTPELREHATKFREYKTEAKSFTTMMEMEAEEIRQEVEKFRAEMSKKLGYVGGVKVRDNNDLTISVIYQHKYKNCNITNADRIKGILKSRYEDLVEEGREISVNDTSNAGLTELQKMVKNSLKVELGRVPTVQEVTERFVKVFGVTRYLYPTRRYTEEFYTTLTEKERKELETIIEPYKPQMKI
jgi:hypothetical protein